MRLLFGIAAAFLLLAVRAEDTDYDSFMASLSYNWQNEFSDLRYQVAQLQKDNPQQYNQLAAQLGLKQGASINVPSQFDAGWASKFVQAAGLYTPPAVTQAAATFDPLEAKPTAAQAASLDDGNLFASALKATPTAASKDADDDDSDSQDDDGENDDNSGNDSTHASSTKKKSSSSASGSKSSSKSKNSSSSDDSGDDNVDSEEEVSQQFGNPIVGSLNTDNAPIVPSGQGYSSATKQHPALVSVMLIALFSPFL
ncbi:hypothetical protein GGI07_001136 [Coemansia sp. Benny D115]|nr:hypothetical protein GGI07_001136 [Coemansia sp. Benny D115]